MAKTGARSSFESAKAVSEKVCFSGVSSVDCP